MKRTKMLLSALAVWTCGFAQETHVIEPAILEVRYDSWQEEHDDSYILRTGKTNCQFFSYFRYRTDSLENTNDATRHIALQEFFDSNDRSEDRSKRLKASTIGREWLYQDITTGRLSLYSNYAGDRQCYEEDIPTQEWSIVKDSTMEILGMTCHYATTKFRGREWNVWYTEEVPASLGPWKLNGLPGLILKATADDDFIKFTAISLKTDGINPVTFYNWDNESHYKTTREKFLKYKNRPRPIPYANKVLSPKPYIELE